MVILMPVNRLGIRGTHGHTHAAALSRAQSQVKLMHNPRSQVCFQHPCAHGEHRTGLLWQSSRAHQRGGCCRRQGSPGAEVHGRRHRGRRPVHRWVHFRFSSPLPPPPSPCFIADLIVFSVHDVHYERHRRALEAVPARHHGVVRGRRIPAHVPRCRTRPSRL